MRRDRQDLHQRLQRGMPRRDDRVHGRVQLDETCPQRGWAHHGAASDASRRLQEAHWRVRQLHRGRQEPRVHQARLLAAQPVLCQLRGPAGPQAGRVPSRCVATAGRARARPACLRLVAEPWSWTAQLEVHQPPLRRMQGNAPPPPRSPSLASARTATWTPCAQLPAPPPPPAAPLRARGCRWGAASSWTAHGSRPDTLLQATA
jgi:hypothetical protein